MINICIVAAAVLASDWAGDPLFSWNPILSRSEASQEMRIREMSESHGVGCTCVGCYDARNREIENNLLKERETYESEEYERNRMKITDWNNQKERLYPH